MKLSLNWLSELVDLKGISAQEVGERLTLHTAEVEAITSQKPFFQNIFAGKFISVADHPESKKLHVGQFDLGEHGKKQIIFGEVHELHIGEIYPIVLAGTTLKSGMEVRDAELKGVKSEGMVADNPELGMKNEGLIRWHNDKLIGKSLPEIEPNFADTILEIDNKSLTHRPDLWGHYGFARELSSIFNRPLRLPVPKVKIPEKGDQVSVRVETEVCRRHCFLKLSGIKIGPSPLSRQIMLENLDVRAISNLVDITNWILLGIGQPMHVFDTTRVDGGFIIRQAKKGEKLLALDGVEYEFTPADTLVTDEKKSLSVAGIMGGEHSGVSNDTKEIIFECANWDPVAVRKTSARLGLRSDSSIRYEKALDPALCRDAILVATEMTLEDCPKAKILGPLTDEFPGKKTAYIGNQFVSLDPNYLRMHSGLSISDDEILKALKSIGFGAEKKSGKIEVQIPSYRATKDVSIAEDVIEEVVRLYGFESIPSTLPSLPVTPPKMNWMRKLDWEVRDFLCAHGFLEVKNYSFTDSHDQKFTGKTKRIAIENPLSDEHAYLRTTLISNIAKNIESELRTHGEMHLFEIGKQYHPSSDILPEEIPTLALFSAKLLSGKRETQEAEDFFMLKDCVTSLLRALGVEPSFCPPENIPPFSHPAKCAEIKIGEEVLGIISSLHPTRHPAKNASFMFAEINLQKLLKCTRNVVPQYQTLSPYPNLRRDISLLMEKRTPMGDIVKTAQSVSPLLRKIELFDEFSDDQRLGKGKKNLSFHLEFNAQDRTLDDQEVDAIFAKIVQTLKAKHQTQLRGEKNT